MSASVLFLSACTTVYQPNSPDVAYSDTSADARPLQVPPDLTDVSDGEQFVLPGTNGGAVSRNTLLPEFDQIRFVRDGASSWLEVDRPAEDLWPRLLAFLKQEKYRVEQTQPVAGLLATQWRSPSDVDGGGLLKNLIRGNDDYSRVAFRMERSARGTRLFARSQSGSEDDATSDAPLAWPASSADPEATNELLSRLLVFLGVDEQRTRGILNQAQADSVLLDAQVLTTASGSQLVVHRGYRPSFKAIQQAMALLNYNVQSSDNNVGRIQFASVEKPQEALTVIVTPVHLSAVRVSIADVDGRRLPLEQEKAVLDSLAGQLT